MTTPPFPATDGLAWGVRRSFVEYLRGLDDGEFTADGGAAVDDRQVFHFPLRSADDYDPVARTGTVRFAGRAALGGHFGALSVVVEDPWLEFGAGGATLTVADPDRDAGHRVPLLDLDLPTAPGPDGGPAPVEVPTRLTVEGTSFFNGQYPPGSAMDPVSVVFPVSAASGRTNADPTVVLDLHVTERVDESDDVVSLVLTDPSGAPLPQWAPGSHVDVHVGAGLVRQYSLSSVTPDAQRWRITVLREDGGRVSGQLHSALPVGATVQVSLPRNNFPLLPAPRYVFVAGGIGITPLVPMVEAAQRSGADWRLLYSGRNRSRMPFLEQLAGYGSDRAQVVDTSTTDRIDLAAWFRTPQPDTLVYACGPEPMLQAVEAATAHWPAGSLHTERFVPKEFDDSGDVEFEVEFVDSGVVATVPVGRSILEIAEENDVPVISSCAEGTCGTCETVVLEGRPDHRDSILTDAEREESRTMFLCVSRSVGGCRLRLQV
jgi:ferredoxin-NADP reductase